MHSLYLLTLAAAGVVANVVVDDNTCHRNKGVCEPQSLCEYNYNFGDLSFDQSCRVKDGVNYPQQIHLAFAGTKTGMAMTVSWATFEDVTDSSVWVGSSEDTLELVETPVSSDSYYSDDEYDLFHHHATITGLKPRTKYFYKVGSRGDEKYTSEVSSFITARPATDDSTFNALIYGDLGDGKNSVDTIAAVNKMTSDDIDLVYHLGDVSYADNDFLTVNQAAGFFYEEVYNKWMNSLMPLMSCVPYMVLVGNHEAECHSPSVLNSENDVPTGQTAEIQAAFEDLFLKYKVDVVLTGHKHYYERGLPIANNKAVLDGVSNDYEVYDNPQAPVHILTGGAGQSEGLSIPPSHTASWNAVSDYEHFGYSMLEANRSTLVWKYILSSDQTVQDEFVMYKTDPTQSDS
ncbi:hypothetical protein JG688_00014117 [Phytophthora aleatoria]|uniref:Purple acid phosphatase n=1 Tax=Phytophthora aleatoria TaxID=2496075 RepID=A0A8J5M0N5_9STRA|nr:hypothetical protein JG688_00014117 [Phytophthora aleatoria]